MVDGSSGRRLDGLACQRLEGRDVEHRGVELALDARPGRRRVVAQAAGEGAVAVGRLQLLDRDNAGVTGHRHLGRERLWRRRAVASEKCHELVGVLGGDLQRQGHAVERQGLLGVALQLHLGARHVEMALDREGLVGPA